MHIVNEDWHKAIEGIEVVVMERVNRHGGGTSFDEKEKKERWRR